MLGKDTKRRVIFDTILVVAILALALSALLIVHLTKDEGGTVLVTVDGERVGEYPLSVDAEYTLNDGTNTLVIREGTAYMTAADCPDKICVNKGRIYLVGDDITCLPNRVRVEIVE